MTRHAHGQPALVGAIDDTFSGLQVLALPLIWASDVVGVMWMARVSSPEDFSPAEQDRVHGVISFAVEALQRLHQPSGLDRVLSELGDTRTRQGDAIPTRRGVSYGIRRLVVKTRTILGAHAVYLSRIDDGRQIFEVIDADPDVETVAEGFEMPAADSFCGMMLAGQLPTVITDVGAHPVTATHPLTTSIGIASYCAAPVVLPNGAIYGTLSGFDYRHSRRLSSQQRQGLRTMATLIGLHLGKELEKDRERDADRHAFKVFIDTQARTTVLQPIVDLATGTVNGFEALSRFTPTAVGLPRRPDEIFARAEQLGLTLELEQAAARSALDLLPQLSSQTYLSINLSPDTLIHPSTIALMSGYDLRRVVIELTEHEQVKDYGAVLTAVNQLRHRGARLAIDDLGSGFAGLQHLARLRPDVVKLDISFVRDINKDPTRAAVARAVSGFAAEVGATLVAEGIETAAELSRLHQLGATHGQGYFLGRPAPIADVLLPNDGGV